MQNVWGHHMRSGRIPWPTVDFCVWNVYVVYYLIHILDISVGIEEYTLWVVLCDGATHWIKKNQCYFSSSMFCHWPIQVSPKKNVLQKNPSYIPKICALFLLLRWFTLIAPQWTHNSNGFVSFFSFLTWLRMSIVRQPKLRPWESEVNFWSLL